MATFDRFKSLEDSRKQKKANLNKLLNKKRKNKYKKSPRLTKKIELEKKLDLSKSKNDSEINVIPPWGKLHAGKANIKYFDRSDNQDELKIQPWIVDLSRLLFESTYSGGLYLCLFWPAQISKVVLLHSLINLERNFSKDLKGVRTLLFPGSHSTRHALQSVLVSREQLTDLFRSLWVNTGDATEIVSHTRSASVESILNVLNDIRINNAQIDNPSLGELVPSFIFAKDNNEWVSVSGNSLERSIKKVDKLAHRKYLREKINKEWNSLEKAPSALMVLHRNTSKSEWKKAVNFDQFGKDSKPELFIYDATVTSGQVNYNAVKRIPDLVNVTNESGYEHTGSVIITDDPQTYLMLRSKLNKLRLKYKTKIWAAESNEPILSSNPRSENWEPKLKSNANFKIAILDRDASQIALSFQRLAIKAGDENSPSYQAVMNACLYILRLSNMPAGYEDLVDITSKSREDDFINRSTSWSPVILGLKGVLESGVLNEERQQVEKSISKAEELIDNWKDATPMAAKLLAEVNKYVIDEHQRLSIILSSGKYIQLAKCFLERKLGKRWISVEKNLEWHTLMTVNKILTEDCKNLHFLFAGINRNVVRLLISNDDIPHGTSILITYKQAESTLKILKRMLEIEEFKPYRGRMGLLAQQLEQRLLEIPNPINIDKLNEMRMFFDLDNDDKSSTNNQQSCYKFELEGGEYVYESGWTYRYTPDDDPLFSRVPASKIQSGDFIFKMSDTLRVKLESVLELTDNDESSRIYPERILLKLYHDDIKNRCEMFFSAKKRTALAKQIYKKMVEIDPTAAECRPGRVYYWLDIDNDMDSRPHASKNYGYFKVFCNALQISDDSAKSHWYAIRNARNLSQNLGRELSARYAEILFQPESAIIYRNVTEENIKQLQQDALLCVHHVENVISPKATVNIK